MSPRDFDLARFFEDWAMEQVAMSRLDEVAEPWTDANDATEDREQAAG